MKKDFYFLSKDGETNIHASEWIPEGDPKAVLQICHGMVEYIGRYSDFAEYLAKAGFYVTGHDHLGHGESVTSDDKHGWFHESRGNEYLIGDIHELRKTTERKYPDVPYFIMGHSMGSFLTRQYITSYGSGIKGAIIMGTGSYPVALLKSGIFLSNAISAIMGPEHRSRIIDNIAFGSYNKHFKTARTTHDWLTKDGGIVDRYLADPWCTFMFTARAYNQMFNGIEQAQDKENVARIPKDLPILIISGDNDPVGGFGKGVMQAFETYKKAMIKDLNIKLYPEDRHEILNETDRGQVYEDIKKWLEARI